MARRIVEGRTPMADVLEESMTADLLFLDDVGAESDKFKTGETVDAICQLLSRREGRWTVISLNYGPDKWVSRFDPRVSDRLWRQTELLDLTGAPSWSAPPA
jgi:DNA replication protein DnaC